jgi:hypothetical protein
MKQVGTENGTGGHGLWNRLSQLMEHVATAYNFVTLKTFLYITNVCCFTIKGYTIYVQFDKGIKMYIEKTT